MIYIISENTVIYEMARKAANRATNVNAVLLACERSQILFSFDQQQQRHQKRHTSMPKKSERVRAKQDSDVYEVEDILDDRLDPKVGMLHITRDIYK